MNKFAKICMVGWTILCFMGSCSGMVNLSQGTQGQHLNGAEALGAGIGLFMWLIIWAVPMVVLGIIALVTRPSAPAAPVSAAGVAAVLCSQCGNYHAVNVSFCPHCGSPSSSQDTISQPEGSSPRPSGRARQFILVALVIVFAVVAYRLLTPAHQASPTVNDTRQSSTRVADPQDESGDSSNALQISAGQLFWEYQQNEVLADSKYKGKRLSVTGVVSGIRKGLFDEAILELATTNRFESVSAYLDSSENSVAAGLSKGANVTVLCEGDGMTVGSPMLRRCHVEATKIQPEPIQDCQPRSSVTPSSDIASAGQTPEEGKGNEATADSVTSANRVKQLASALTEISSKAGRHLSYSVTGEDAIIVGDPNAPEDGFVDGYRTGNNQHLAAQMYSVGLRNWIIINGRPHQIWGFKVTPTGFEEITPPEIQGTEQ